MRHDPQPFPPLDYGLLQSLTLDPNSKITKNPRTKPLPAPYILTLTFSRQNEILASFFCDSPHRPGISQTQTPICVHPFSSAFIRGSSITSNSSPYTSLRSSRGLPASRPPARHNQKRGQNWPKFPEFCHPANPCRPRFSDQ